MEPPILKDEVPSTPVVPTQTTVVTSTPLLTSNDNVGKHALVGIQNLVRQSKFWGALGATVLISIPIVISWSTMTVAERIDQTRAATTKIAGVWATMIGMKGIEDALEKFAGGSGSSESLTVTKTQKVNSGE